MSAGEDLLRDLIAAGTSPALVARVAILTAKAAEHAEKEAAYLERKRINQRNHRERNRTSGNSGNALSPLSPPLMVSLNNPSLTPPSIPPIPLCAVASATRTKYDEAFERFWKAYPRRHGSNPKFPAGKLFLAAVKAGADAEEIISGVRNFAADPATKIGTEFVPQTVKWLRDKRWQDYSAAQSNVVAFGYWIGMDTAEWDAWARHRGKPFSLDKRGGWTAPSQWPPGFEPRREAAE